jgi:hypothetical protein
VGWRSRSRGVVEFVDEVGAAKAWRDRLTVDFGLV